MLDDLTLLTLLVAAFASARITRFVVVDDWPEPLRMAVTRRAHRPGPAGDLCDWLDRLISCHWCAGVWASAGVVGAMMLWGHLPAVTFVVVTLAVAEVQAIVNEREERRGVHE